jgi:hypothetical protein
MASRFEKVDDEFIEERREMNENVNIKTTQSTWKSVIVKRKIRKLTARNPEQTVLS